MRRKRQQQKQPGMNVKHESILVSVALKRLTSMNKKKARTTAKPSTTRDVNKRMNIHQSLMHK